MRATRVVTLLSVIAFTALRPTVSAGGPPSPARSGRLRQALTARRRRTPRRAPQPLKAEQSRVAAEPAFFRTARAAIAHGKRTDAESLARARGAGDAAAAAILGRLAIDRGQYDDALALLEPAADAQSARRGGARARPAAAPARPGEPMPRGRWCRS